MLEDLAAALSQALGGSLGSGLAIDPAQMQGVPLPKQRDPRKPSWDSPTPLPNHVRAVRLSPLLMVHIENTTHDVQRRSGSWA